MLNTSKQSRLIFLDALRGYSIFGIILVHCVVFGNKLSLPVFVKNFAESGARGVTLFFIISAYTLAGAFFENKVPSLRGYAIKRFFRIAPLYWIGIILYAIIFTDSFYNWPGITTNALFIHAFFPDHLNSVVPGGWSISCEVIFYAVLPFIVRYLDSISKTIVWIVSSIVVSWVFKWMIITYYSNYSFTLSIEDFKYFNVINQFPIFLLGIFSYHLRDFFVLKTINECKLYLVILILLLTIVSFIGTFSLNYLVFGLLFSLIVAVLSKDEFHVWFFENPFIAQVGKISYGIYIYHFAVLFFLRDLGFLNNLDSFFMIYNGILDLVARFVLTFFFSFILAYLSYTFIEIPFVKIGAHLNASYLVKKS